MAEALIGIQLVAVIHLGGMSNGTLLVAHAEKEPVGAFELHDLVTKPYALYSEHIVGIEPRIASKECVATMSVGGISAISLASFPLFLPLTQLSAHSKCACSSTSRIQIVFSDSVAH